VFVKRAAILTLALLAVACTEEAATPAEQRAAAAGEVLGGEISDAMIPLEQLESQAPLAPRAGPSAADIDAEQPEVSGELAGIENGGANEGAEPATAAPTPQTSAAAPVTE
jgi:hypothetical protein